MISRFLWFICIVFASCSKTVIRNDSQTVRMSIESDPKTLDPRKARDLNSSTVLHMLFEGLMRIDKEGNVVPAVAEKIVISNDGLKYTFELRETKWSNGKDVSSYDFAYAWKQILEPSFPSDTAYHLFLIKNAKKIKQGELSIDELGVQCLDKKTLCIELENPAPYFLSLLTMPTYFPVSQEIVSQNPLWDQSAKNYVSNGPFVLQNWDHSFSLTLTKNTEYQTCNEQKVLRIDLLIANPDTALRMFEEGKLDWIGSPLSIIPVDAMESLRQEKKLRSAPFLGVSFCRINVREEINGFQNPLSNKFFRKALSYAVDRYSIVEHVLRGGQKEALSLVPSFMGLRKEGGYFPEKPLQVALELLDASEKTEQQLDRPLEISYCNNEKNTLLAQVLQKQWEDKLHLNIQLKAYEPKLFFQKISQGDYQIALGSWIADFNDPINFLEVFKYKENGTNQTGWENQQYIDLLNHSELFTNLEERKEILEKAETILMDEMPIIPIYELVLNYIANDSIANLSISKEGQLDFFSSKN